MPRRHTSFAQRSPFKALFLLSLIPLSLIALIAMLRPASPSLPVIGNPEESAIDDAASTPDQAVTALILGKDVVGENTDVMLLASFRPRSGEMNLIQIPRDTYVQYEGNGVKLGSMYARLKREASMQGAENPTKAAMHKLTATLGRHLDLDIHYYLLLDLNAFAKTIDALGGVTVDLPRDMDYDDPEQGLSIHLKAGVQTLNGEKAMMFVRFRAGYANADLGRLDAQKLFLRALIDKIKTPRGAMALVASMPKLLSGMVTNAPLSDCIYYLGLASGINTEALSMQTLAGEPIHTKDGKWFYVLRASAAKEQLGLLRGKDGAFDTALVFTDQNNSEIHEIYSSPATSGGG